MGHAIQSASQVSALNGARLVASGLTASNRMLLMARSSSLSYPILCESQTGKIDEVGGGKLGWLW
jgi:hypothetical protein